MPNFTFPFDASSVPAPQYLPPVPADQYLMHIISSEFRPTRDGRGEYLLLELEVIEGQYTGRKVFERLNLTNDNPRTVQYAEQTLSSICRAVGKAQVTSSEQLHHIPLIADVRVEPAKNGYDERNSVKRFLPRAQPGGPAPTPVAPRPAPSTPPAPAAAAQPTQASRSLPWKRPG
jgi:hypothetical protein